MTVVYVICLEKPCDLDNFAMSAILWAGMTNKGKKWACDILTNDKTPYPVSIHMFAIRTSLA